MTETKARKKVIIEVRAKESQVIIEASAKKISHYWIQCKRKFVIIEASAIESWSLLKPDKENES